MTIPNKGAEFSLKVKLDLPYEQALEKVTEALREEGFGVLSKIDVKATLKEKLNADFRKYIILGACNPPLAHRALSADLDVGLLLPCNVVVYEEEGGSVVGLIDPISMLGIITNPEIEPVAKEARSRLERVARALSD
jgi:uncharacterized protein (DUF302 family)